MTTIADELIALPAGARFYRADLHIHSYSASHDVKDTTMTPQAIVDSAVSEGLALIAITDHNEISNVGAALKAAEGKSVKVIPGVELSTPEGHLLVYFSDLVALQAFHGKLALAGQGSQESRCQTSLFECLQKIDRAKGFAVLAHLDADAGLESRVPGSPPHKTDILIHPALLGFEVRSAATKILYSDLDDDAERRSVAKKRIEALALGRRQFLARLLFSDSHSLAALGRNTNGLQRMTRIKMDSPSFEGLRIALQDADARVRLEDEVPKSVAYVLGVKLEGGLLDGISVHFSRNLNCIIGGRGAGKSTAFETVRCLAPVTNPNDLVDCEVWPEKLTLVWVDEVGQQTTMQRRIHEDCVNVTDGERGRTTFPIESYGQNETAQTSRDAQKDAGALLRYLDQFVDISELHWSEEEIRSQLLESQTEIEKAQQQVVRIPDAQKLLTTTEQQLKVLESANAQEIVSLERKIAEERTLRETIETQVLSLHQHARKSAVTAMLTSLTTIARPEELKVGASELRQILDLATALQAVTTTAEMQLSKDADTFQVKVKDLLTHWKLQEQTVLSQIDAKRKELLAKGIRLDLPFIKKLAADEAAYKELLKTLATWEIRLKELQTHRQTLLVKRRSIRSKIFTHRNGYAVKANEALKRALDDLNVNVKFIESASSTEGAQIIQQAANWKTSQVPRAALIVEQVTVPKLLEAIGKNDPGPLLNVSTSDGLKPFSRTDALELIRVLSVPEVLFRLQRCIVEDLPRITVSRIVGTGSQTKVASRDFAKLSLGQQQSILLSLMLSSDSRDPLIIDQPEDNLDSEFIFHSLVPVLRAAKERRQVIVVTHNPNIAVLGDAEQIIALKSTNDRSRIVARGSIDEPSTKEMVCRILEGAVEAFKRRAKMYGVI